MSINWAEQWALHAPNFKDGFSSIDLSEYGMQGVLRMQPGAGFGDTSHPTTRLVLRLMAKHVKGKHLIDIGCGCGILSIAGLMNGARSCIGIDIDDEALTHAQENAKLNGFANVSFLKDLPSSLGKEPLIVINMISSEQRHAWQACAPLHQLHCPVIASGILARERDEYLEQMRTKRHWHLRDELQEEEWLAFLFE